MPGPRRDFECRKCEATYEDLPVESKRCPVCGFKRGFRALFNRINVAATGHAATKFIDANLGPQMHQHALRQHDVDDSEKRLQTERDVMYEKASSQQREIIAQHGPPIQWQGARSYGSGPTVLAGASPDKPRGSLSIPREAAAHSAWPFVKRN